MTIPRFIILVALFVAACNPIKKYQHEKKVTDWEPSIRELEKRDSTEHDPADAILFAGSSSIRLWDNIHEDMRPYNVIQRGYGGATISDLAVYCRRIIYPHDFKALAIFIANDITGSKEDKTPEEVLHLFQYIVKQVRKKYPDKPVFFIQITPTNSRWKVWDKASQANTLISNWCNSQKNLYFIETASAIIGENGLPKKELFRDDQLHLNPEGYKVWAMMIKKKLDEALK